MSDKRIIPNWLKELQENSWELELLISGGAIFTLFQVSDIWIAWLQNIAIISYLPGRIFYLILGTLGLETLKLGFIIHLICRAFWLSMVCINYVYTSGIKPEKVKWKKPFSSSDSELDLQNQIIKVDRLCGLVMFLSIISSFLLTGLLFAFFLLYSVPLKFEVYSSIFLYVVLIIFLTYILDLILNGLLRKIIVISYIVYPFFIILDFISLRKIYEKSALLFSTNVSKWKLFCVMIIFIPVAFMFSYLNTYKIMQWPNIFDDRIHHNQMTSNILKLNSEYYRNEIDIEEISKFSIQSKVIAGNYLELIIRYDIYDDFKINLLAKSKPNSTLSDLFEIEVNDSTYHNTEWFEIQNKSLTKNGIFTMIPISNFKNGKNVLTIKCSTEIKEIDEDNACEDVQILFWNDSE